MKHACFRLCAPMLCAGCIGPLDKPVCDAANSAPEPHPYYEWEESNEAGARRCAEGSSYDEEGMDYAPMGWGGVTVGEEVAHLSQPSVGTLQYEGESYPATITASFDPDRILIEDDDDCDGRGWAYADIAISAAPVVQLTVPGVALSMRSDRTPSADWEHVSSERVEGDLYEHPYMGQRVRAYFYTEGGASVGATGWLGRLLWGDFEECQLDITTTFGGDT